MEARTSSSVRSHNETLETSLAEVLKSKDQNTHEHSSRVAALTSEWVKHMQARNEWTNFDETDLVIAARLHDVGKVRVQNEILNKQGPLSSWERFEMNQHAEIGFELLRQHRAPRELALAVLHHHERWDGSGYPAGLSGHQIPLFAQIIGIVDTYDAIVSDRPYRKGRSNAEAIQEIQNAAGSQFSPDLVFAFVKFLNARRN